MPLTLSGSNGVAGVDGSAGTPALQGSDSNTGIAFGADTIIGSTGGSERFRVDSSGRLGIGTTSPTTPIHCEAAQAELQLKSTTGTNSAGLRFVPGGQTNAWYIYANGSRNLVFDDHASERMRIDSSGRLLVGTSSVLANASSDARVQILGGTEVLPGLRIQATNSNNAGCLQLGNDPTGSGTTCGIRITGDTGGGTTYNTYRSSGGDPYHSFAVNSTDRMRINSAGQQFHYTNNTLFYMRSAAGATSTDYFLQGFYGASGITSGGTESVRITTNGDVRNTNNSYGAISDIKLKENIVDANSQWDDIKALHPVNYNFKEGQTHTQLGLIAQEVELVSPGLVTESPDLDADGNDLGTTTKSVNYSVLYMKAVKALQEAMERIESLETRLAALEVTP